MIRTRYIAPILVVLFAATMGRAQVLPEFNMMDTVVTDCKGILLDSEGGPGGNTYGNNESFTFTISTGAPITMTFSPLFCVEQGFDFLWFYDGPNTNSPLILGPWTGIIAPPPITANSGHLTVHFVSDHSVNYCGWEAQWTTLVAPPVPPVMSIPAAPLCNAATMNVQFSYPIPCAALQSGAFSLSGNGDPAVSGAQASPCQGGQTSTAQLTVDPVFDRDCHYTLSFEIGLPDACDSIWFFTLTANTLINTCPLGVLVEASQDTICAGQCVQLFADVQGCLAYSYSWSNAMPATAGPLSACPTETTTYTVTVTEQGTGQTATGSRTITVIDPQITAPSGNVCQSADPFVLPASPPGGWWSGVGILDTLAGIFHPDTAGPGAHALTYQLAFGCATTIALLVDSMDAGLPEAACPGTEPFMVSGHTPQGGTWSGPFISPQGLFDPVQEGSFTVTYSAGSCSDTKEINVGDLIGPSSPLDTVCQSERPFVIPVSPFGGRWSGPGIVDTLYGVFDPHEAAGGDHLLTYTMHGCSAQYWIHVKPADIGDDRSACPSQGPFTLTPAAIPPGGTWVGAGIADPVAGVYDPLLVFTGQPFWDMVTYAAPNGCVDTINILTTWTDVRDDTLWFCTNSAPRILNGNTTGRTPWDGAWSGPGISQNSDGDWFFTPSVAGVGLHALIYSANGCDDQLTVVVHPAVITAPPITVCGAQDAFVLLQLPPGANWNGPGIINAATGLFSPTAAGAGQHTVQVSTPAGCSGQVLVDVVPLQPASIGGVAAQYCGNDQLVQVQLSPQEGVFTGLPQPQFNPAQLAPGTYTLVYTTGSGACSSSDTVTFVNHPALQATLSTSLNTICGGGSAQLQLSISGGRPGHPYWIQWDQGLFPVENHTVSPEETTTYTVQVTDYCSDPIVLSTTIDVWPEFTPEFTYSGMQCYGEPGWIEGEVPQEGDYTFMWNTSPPQQGSSVQAPAGQSFLVVVTNTASGCTEQQLVQVPSWPAVTALFSANPEMPCVPWDMREVTFIDLSHNAVGGTWTINGVELPYVPGEYPSYDLGVAGYYNVALTVHNEGGCESSCGASVCILASTRVFVPDAFSPNGDGLNDVLYVRAPGMGSMLFRVFDRWGSVVFESRDTMHGWDGRTNKGLAPDGIYVYALEAEMMDGERISLTGDVTLVR
ncbi:MAG: gliding motility-associated C-terminal domain-containing protein [Flavobacteriales bacterium]|nr:gliding motility-associated C-terminal domain-containing protein [Flavobacteriales bacterium]